MPAMPMATVRMFSVNSLGVTEIHLKPVFMVPSGQSLSGRARISYGILDAGVWAKDISGKTEKAITKINAVILSFLITD